MEQIFEIVKEACVDTGKLVPFLFLTYLLMEWLEHKTGSRTQALILRTGKAGPLFGGVLLGCVLFVGALLFLPVAVLGPVAEHLACVF